MLALRMDTLGEAGPVPESASPFHVLMADRMVREGVLRRLRCGGYLLAVRSADLPAIESPASVVPFEGVHLAELRTFPEVLDAEMRCALLQFPEDYRHPGEGVPGALPETGDAPRECDVLARMALDVPEIERILRAVLPPADES